MSLKRISYAYLGLIVTTIRKAQDSSIQAIAVIQRYTDEMTQSWKSPPMSPNREQLEQRIDDGIQNALMSLRIPKQEDVRKVYAKLHDLTEKVKQVVVAA